uniref:GTP 3',8-cyclase n=1 Tax=Palpitomonas bilix TaxID=652834 RepID=A0A7S3G9V7_9EUKA|mmetsp:Transcript_39163/g.100331  ORF Transcript_39163/g.100331 Transcript_39163/m.100331 type:complete len:377 (+) Transcript_39163:2-1132(+)
MPCSGMQSWSPTFALMRGTRSLLSSGSQMLQLKELAAKCRSQLVSPSAALTDSFGRFHNYLRISLTERCNLRCQYCMPEQGIDLTQNADLLQTDELLKLAKVFTSLGVDKVRLTGGEPLVRKDFLDVFEGLSSDEKITSLGLTTNGITLSRHLPKMVDMAGLDRLRINISLDTLSDKKYAFISRRNGYDKVMRSIDDCISAGLSSLKVNVVVMRNVNEDEVLDFVEFTKDRDIEVRFIEYMPFDDNKWSAKKMVSYAEMLDMIKRKYPLQRAVGDVNDTSKVYHVPGHAGRVGFITSMSDHFCGGCNRIRLLADGNLKVCLFGANEISLRDALRWGLPEEDISALVHGALLKKKFKHAGMFDLSQMKNRPMIKIGG